MDKQAQKTKVLFVITKSNFGGAQKYVYDIATKLPSEKFEVVVLLGGTGSLVQKLKEKNIRTMVLPKLVRDINPFKEVVNLFKFWKIIRAEHPDVLHINSAKAGGLGAVAGRLAGVPKIIFTAHGWAFKEDRSFLSRTLIKTLSWITILLVHKTIAVSDAVFSDMQWLGASRKMVVIKNGLEEPKFFPREEARRKFLIHTNPLSSNAFIVGTLAELHKNKGLADAIKAFAKIVPDHPQAYYLILGEGEEKECLETLIERLKLRENIFLLGFVEGAARLLKGLDVFVLPSTKEGLPYVLLEAGLARLPVVATTVGGIPEIIAHGKTGFLVPPHNPDALAYAIKKFISDPPKRGSLGKNLYVKVTEEFSLSRSLAETTSLYTEKRR